jgi:DNA-binding PadR family transcriptional regulator
MALRYALLGSLADQPRTGYALVKHFEQSLAFAWPASHSQIYPELARLLDERLIEQTGAGARNSKTYAVTESGLDEIRHWLRDTAPDRRVRSDAALRGFFLWLLDPDEAEDQLDAEREYWQGVLDEYLRIRDEPTGRNKKARTLRIALEGGIRGAEARLGWLEWAIAEIRSPAWRELDPG